MAAGSDRHFSMIISGSALRDGAARLAIGRPAVAAPVARPDLPVSH
jgi:hypothetical protein